SAAACGIMPTRACARASAASTSSMRSMRAAAEYAFCSTAGVNIGAVTRDVARSVVEEDRLVVALQDDVPLQRAGSAPGPRDQRAAALGRNARQHRVRLVVVSG